MLLRAGVYALMLRFCVLMLRFCTRFLSSRYACFIHLMLVVAGMDGVPAPFFMQNACVVRSLMLFSNYSGASPTIINFLVC